MGRFRWNTDCPAGQALTHRCLRVLRASSGIPSRALSCFHGRMRATVLYGAGDIRVENVPDAGLIEQTDALVVVSRAAICGTDLWPYKSAGQDDAGRRMGH